MYEETTLLQTDSLMQRYRRRILFLQLKHGYEVAAGFKVAREEVLIALKNLQRDGSHFLDIKKSIEKDLKDVRTALLDVQRLYSEIAASITTVVASRTVLNKQRYVIEELHQEGLLDSNEYKKMKGSVEFKMKKLITRPPLIKMPKKFDILRQVPWLDEIGEQHLSEICTYFEDVVFQRGDVLVEENDLSDSVHIIARGTVVVSTMDRSKGSSIDIDELGMGTVFGEIAWVLKCPRLASITATSPGLLLSIPGDSLRQIADSNQQLERKLWLTCGYRLSENMLTTLGGKSRRQIRDVVHDMELYCIDPMNKNICFRIDGCVILLQGVAIVRDGLRGTNEVIEAPEVISGIAKSGNLTYFVEFSTNAKYMCHHLTIIEYDSKNDIANPTPASGTPKKTSIVDLELFAARSIRDVPDPSNQQKESFRKEYIMDSSTFIEQASSCTNRSLISIEAVNEDNIA